VTELKAGDVLVVYSTNESGRPALEYRRRRNSFERANRCAKGLSEARVVGEHRAGCGLSSIRRGTG